MNVSDGTTHAVRHAGNMPTSLSHDPPTRPTLGATPSDGGTTFALWSTRAQRAAVVLFTDASTRSETIPLERGPGGIFSALVRGVAAGALYKFEIDGDAFPDPYARYLPFGVHGPARVEARAVTAPRRTPLVLAREVLYELHVGAFTPEGTFRAALEKLPSLAALGVTAVELMPISSFAGERGWGYDGVAHFAPFAGYGAPSDLRAFVDGAHDLGLGVILDVVYNHFGPSGNYLTAYAPEYFTAEHRTAWGDAPDFANAYLRAYVLGNARYWLTEFGFDGLRLDATHGILDDGAPHVLRELSDMAHALEPKRVLIAEDERNDPSLVTSHGLDAVWADDFHHGVRVTLTGEQDGYYRAYAPGAAGIARTISRGWLYEGGENPLTQKPRGAPADGLTASRFVYCLQNHDQVGNRAFGDRLSHDLSPNAYAAASMLLLFLPQTPLLFMGQEWAATSPFLYFTDHDADLGERVSKGRRSEFEHFDAFGKGDGPAVPDPQELDTFARSKLAWAERDRPEHARVLALYAALLKLRREDAVLSHRTGDDRRNLASDALPNGLLRIRRTAGERARTLYVNLTAAALALPDPIAGSVVLASRDDALAGDLLAGESAVLVEG